MLSRPITDVPTPFTILENLNIHLYLSHLVQYAVELVCPVVLSFVLFGPEVAAEDGVR